MTLFLERCKKVGTTPNLRLPFPEAASPDDVPKDIRALAVVLDAKLAELEAKAAARDELIVSTDGAGNFYVTTGMGEEVPVSTDGDGNWSVIK